MRLSGTFGMTRRAAIAAVLGAAFIFGVISPQPAAADDGAGQFIEILGERAVDVLKDKPNTTFASREAAFRELLVDGFHIPTISRFVIGRYWRAASEEQRENYNAVFVDFITRVYAARFDAYNGEVFEVLQVLPEEESGDSIVRTHILRPSGGEPVGVDYRVRKINGTYKVVDVNVEGISMLHTHRVEFASVINKRGLDGFLEMLHARVDAPVEENGG